MEYENSVSSVVTAFQRSDEGSKESNAPRLPQSLPPNKNANSLSLLQDLWDYVNGAKGRAAFGMSLKNQLDTSQDRR